MSARLLIVPVLFAAALVGCSGDGRPSRPYAWNDLQLITAYTAKTACSCLFVEERTEQECRDYARQSPAVASWSADLGAKTVESSAAMVWTARARFVSDRFGCELE